MKRYRVVFTGQVQGVGFRWVMMNKVSAYGITGWVRNCYNGNVECELQGDPDAVVRLINDMRTANRWIYVDDYIIKEIPLEEHEYNFDVRY